LADTDLTSTHDDPSSLASVPTDLNPSLNDEKLYSSSEIEQLWDCILQTNLTEDNCGLHTPDYHVVKAVSPFYIKFPTHPCIWFVVEPGYFGRAFPSDETKLKSGVVLHLEDSTISTNMLTKEYPTHYIRLTKPIHCDRGYVIYKFTSDLFSRFRTPQPVKPPTNLVTIPEFHASNEAAYLTTQEVTFHQRVLEEDYTIPPLCTWDRDLFSTMPLRNMTWYNEKEGKARG
jgi:hypothetical protein